MIRVLIPRYVYNDERIKLVEKICPLTLKQRDVVRAYSILFQSHPTWVFEGLLENKDKIHAIAKRLTDDPEIVMQSDVDMQTYLIDDNELVYGMGGG